MSTFLPANAIQSFVPTTINLPQDFLEANPILTDYFKRIVAALNAKDIGQYNTQELLNGQLFFTPSDNNAFRAVFRKVIDFGSLPNAATKSVPHGIIILSTTVFTRIYATATDPSTSFIPIPYINTTTPGDSVEISVDATNVNITTTTANYTGYTTCYVILEYIKA